MEKLHDKIIRTFAGIFKPIIPIEVKSEHGWVKVETFNVNDPSDIYYISDGNVGLSCTENHILIDENGDELYAKDCAGKKIRTTCGISNALEVSKLKDKLITYDLSLADGSEHTYYTNKILSHNCVVIDEMSFIPKNVISEFFASVMPVISSSKKSKAIVVSTPNGTDNLYYEIWQQANQRDKSKNKEGWRAIRIDWWEVPGRDQEWKEKQIATIGIERWRQEFGNEFLASSFNKLVPDDKLEQFKMQQSEWKTAGINQGLPSEILSADENKRYTFKMWRKFDESRTYVAAADVAEGTGRDASVLQIWDITDTSNITQCCEFASSKVSTIEFAYIINKICSIYCNPFLIIEQNGIGASVLEQLKVTYDYENLVKLGKDGTYGVRSHIQVKAKACLWFREMLTTDGFGFNIYSKNIVDEMGIFVKKETAVHTVYSALGKNSHDDFMMTLIWAMWLLNEENIEKYFVVAEDFRSTLDKILPKNIQPQFEYSRDEIIAAKTSRPSLQFEEWEDAKRGIYGRTSQSEIAKHVVETHREEPPVPANAKQVIDPVSMRQDRDRTFGYSGGSDDFGWNSGGSDW